MRIVAAAFVAALAALALPAAPAAAQVHDDPLRMQFADRAPVDEDRLAAPRERLGVVEREGKQALREGRVARLQQCLPTKEAGLLQLHPEPGLESFDRYVDVFPYTYCLPPETLADRTWEVLGLWPLYEVYIDPVNIVFDRGVFDVWLLFSATVGGRRGGTYVPPSMVQRMRVNCAERSFRIDEEHYFAGQRGTGCYLGRKGTFFDGHALDRQPPGWKRDILPNRPVALAAERLCPSVVPP